MSYAAKRFAKINATHKGERLTINGEETGVDGLDGRTQYTLGFKPFNPKTGVPAYYTCSCKAFKFAKGNPDKSRKPCKHIRAFLAREAGGVVENGAGVRAEPVKAVEMVKVEAA